VENSSPMSPEATSKHMSAIASITSYAINYAQHFYDRDNFDCNDMFKSDPTLLDAFEKNRDVVCRVLEEKFGLQFAETSQHGMLDSRNVLNEVHRVLQNQHAFCYQMGSHVLLCIAFAQVQIGDCVFRPRAANSGMSIPTEFALIIRLYAIPHCSDSGHFRLVGACVDSCRKIYESSLTALAWKRPLDVILS
jgi:hypothetical protein